MLLFSVYIGEQWLKNMNIITVQTLINRKVYILNPRINYIFGDFTKR
jgi:hypothetical protein